jgi:hypothetical protein
MTKDEYKKLRYESLRKCIDIQITSIMPEQDKLIKTYLWFAVGMFGGALTALFNLGNNNSCPILLFASLFAIAGLASIVFCFLATKSGDTCSYGELEKTDNESYIDEAIRFAETDFEKNRERITTTSNILRRAFWSLSVAFVLFVLFFLIFLVGLF